MVQVMIKCGKHTGRPYGDVARTDPSYCAWVLREKANGTKLSRDLKSFANYVQDLHGGVLVVGRHSGRFFADVLREDPEYGEWAASLENPSKLMIDFHEYVKRRQRRRPRDTGGMTRAAFALIERLTRRLYPVDIKLPVSSAHVA